MQRIIIQPLQALAILFFLLTPVFAQPPAPANSPREHLLMDDQWRFAYGHPSDAIKDFRTGTSYFSYLAKAGYGDGAAAASFDDRAWRVLDLPHDWAVEQPFSSLASLSHGFKAIGRNFPEASVGWYRKSFFLPATDQGRHISIAFDGVCRNTMVWVNGHYLGTEPSGYLGFEYNISEYLHYGGDNTIAVRADVTMEEGWFYEGAGIYRHVWLNKTDPLHITPDGSFVTTAVRRGDAQVTATAAIANEGQALRTATLTQTILDADGRPVAVQTTSASVAPFGQQEVATILSVPAPHRWSVDSPYLYTLVTTLTNKGQLVDRYQTHFGIRTIRFDANEGFFLNGRRLEIKGTNNHQDHAGVGVAIPDALQYFRLKALKQMGCNAYRCSHHPPTPELLDACDRLGLLVIDENRLMGVAAQHFDALKRMIRRDRNHPSVISWSIGNEEWAIEGNRTGASIASTLQAYAKTIDSTRYITAAISGGWGQGISTVIDVMGFNYIRDRGTDAQHKQFPQQFGWGTEEGSTHATRGVYVDDRPHHLIAAYDKKPQPDFNSIEEGWKYYAARPYLAGMFIWTGFDYRGEPTPFGWPSIASYFGMLDLCGFAKDDAWYLKAWWTDTTVVHLLPHWNWSGSEGQLKNVWVYSNCDQVELFLNKKSKGKQNMPRNGHLEWKLPYEQGLLVAVGYRDGKKLAADTVQTTGSPAAVALEADRTAIQAGGRDVSVITVRVTDRRQRAVPDAGNDIAFTLDGPGRIIGVGNGDPTSLEPDQYLETIRTFPLTGLKEKYVTDTTVLPETAEGYDDSAWSAAFTEERDEAFGKKVSTLVYRAFVDLPEEPGNAQVTFFYRSIGQRQSLYVNGKRVAAYLPRSAAGDQFRLDPSWLHKGRNSVAIVATPLLKKQPWEEVNTDAGLVQLVYPAPQWKRRLFNGLAQVIVQSTGQPGQLVLKADSPGLQTAVLNIRSTAVAQ